MAEQEEQIFNLTNRVREAVMLINDIQESKLAIMVRRLARKVGVKGDAFTKEELTQVPWTALAPPNPTALPPPPTTAPTAPTAPAPARSLPPAPAPPPSLPPAAPSHYLLLLHSLHLRHPLLLLLLLILHLHVLLLLHLLLMLLLLLLLLLLLSLLLLFLLLLILHLHLLPPVPPPDMTLRAVFSAPRASERQCERN